jgi:precorrin-3B synthase
MNAVPRRRGWCPSLYDPMETGDGLLVRVHPPGARLVSSAARALADAAAQWGNGAIELTRRGNLQVRGLRPDGVGPFAAAIAAAGLADPDPARERRRVVIAPPLAGDDPGAGLMGLAERIEAALADGPPLASKFCIAVDAGGVLAGRTAPSDILVQVGDDGDRLRGDGFDVACARDRTVDQVLRLVGWADGERLFSLSLRERVGVREATGREPGLMGPPPSRERGALTASLTPTLSRREREQKQTSIIGWHPYPGTGYGALALGLAFGQLDAATLHVLANLSDRFSSGALRTSSFRALLLGRVCTADLPAASRAAEAAGLATNPADPRLLVTSCIGAPGCASATVPARQDAIRLANEGAGPLHVSGCAKGCAYPGAGPALVGAAGQYTLMPDWRPGLDPIS